jgi:hypothetical protein
MQLLNLTISDVQNMLRFNLSLANPVAMMFIGKPGVGKSEGAESVCVELGREVFKLSLGRIENVDIKGMPFPVEKEKYFAFFPPELWHRIRESAKAGRKPVLIMDEVTHATEAVQAACLDVLLTKEIDGEKLPKELAFILLGNAGGDDGTFARSLSTAFVNRCAIYGVRMPEIPEWFEYMGTRLHPVVRKFIEAYDMAAFYVGYDIENPLQPWTSPRSIALFNDAVMAGKLDLNNPLDCRMAAKLAYGFLHPSTADQFDVFVSKDNVSPAALWRMERAAWDMYKGVEDPAIRSSVLKDVVNIAFPVDYVKSKASREKLQPVLEKFLDKLLSAEKIQKPEVDKNGVKTGKTTTAYGDPAKSFLKLCAQRDGQLYIDMKVDGKPVSDIIDNIWAATYASKKSGK